MKVVNLTGFTVHAIMHKSYSLFIFYCAVYITPSSRWLALVLLLPSPLPFQFLPDHLLVLEFTPIPHVNLKGFKICVWSGGSKFPFGDDL